MKKILICALVLSAGLTAAARVLTPEEALQRVSGENSPMKAPASVLQERQLLRTVTTASDAPAVYVFGSVGSQGYMIVSADDVAMPLLGYSDTGSLPADGTLPPQMEWWLGQYAAEIESVQTVSAGSLPVHFSMAAGADRTPIAPMCSTKWNQDAPYNNLCPTMSGKKTYTGCVATAMAQVMKYHNWPERGTGSISYTDNRGLKRSMSFDVKFEWGSMLDSYVGTTTSAQKNAVALLMKACGYSVMMNYGTDSSGASDIYIPGALVTYFDYDAGARRCERNQYGLADWQKMIYDNLRDVGPVLYCGSSHLGGHAFVCDGYASDGYFHFNWGWGGSYDGNYLLTALNPEGEGIGGFAGGYNLGQSIVLGIQKPTGQSTKPALLLTQAGEVSGSVYGGVITLSGAWVNKIPETISFTLALRLDPVDGTTGATRYLESPYGEQAIESGYAMQQLQFDATQVPNGSWKATLVMKDTSLGSAAKWTPMLHPINVPDYVTIRRQGSSYNVVNATTVNLQVTSATLQTPLYYGCSAKLTFTVTNPGDVEVAQSVAPCLISGNSVVAMGAGLFIDLLPGESVTRELAFDLAYTNEFKLNTNYQCYLWDSESGLGLYSLGTQKVLPYPGTPSLSVTSFTLDGGTTVTDPANMLFKTSVKCLSGYLAAPMVVTITDKGGGSGLASGNSSEVMFLNAGDTGSTEFHVSFPTAQAGKTYSAFLGVPTDTSYDWVRELVFTVSTAGVETVASGDSSIEIAYDRATAKATVDSPRGIVAVSVVNAVGTPVYAPVSRGDASAVIDLSQAGCGVAIITVSDPAGATRTVKVIL